MAVFSQFWECIFCRISNYKVAFTMFFNSRMKPVVTTDSAVYKSCSPHPPQVKMGMTVF